MNMWGPEKQFYIYEARLVLFYLATSVGLIMASPNDAIAAILTWLLVGTAIDNHWLTGD